MVSMAQVKKIKAEAFDIMQYFYGNVHDPQIHCLICFSGHVDENALKRAVALSQEALPLLRCCFVVEAGRPYWKVQDFTAEDIVHVIEAGPDAEAQKERMLAATIDIAGEPQLKIFIVRERDCDTLCLIINHMVCDGTGFKEYLYLLSELYNGCLEDPDYRPVLDFLPRNAGQLWAGFGLLKKLAIFLSKFDLSTPKRDFADYLQGDNNNPFLLTCRIPGDKFLNVVGYAKKNGVTVNDMIFTAYIRVLRRETGNDTVVIPCPVDLRKYLPTGRKHGICNLTGNYICKVTLSDHESFETTLAKVAGQINRQKSSANCLKPVMLLELAFRILPFATLRKKFNEVFTVPMISFTNLGIIDKKLLTFGDTAIVDAYMTGAIKYVPYFQIAASTYNNSCTLSSNLHGTARDREFTGRFLAEIKKELLFV